MFSGLARLVGWGFFPLAILAKLPYAMSVVAVMTSVVGARGSYTEAGIASALVGLATAFSGPFFGWFADRYGQRGLLLFLAFTNAASLFGLGAALRSDAPTGLIYLAAFAIGATSPQAASMVRSRWLEAIRLSYSGEKAEKATSVVLPYESFTDEAVFVAGPILVGAIAVAFGIVVPLDVAALTTLIGISGFALHPSARFVRGHVRNMMEQSTADEAEAAPAAAPASEIFRLSVLLPPAGMACIGMFFGSTLASLTSFLGQFDNEAAAGMYYAVMGIGSALCAFAVVLLPRGFSFAARWMVFSAVAFIGTLVFTVFPVFPAVLVGLVLCGIGIGPTLVTLFSIAAEVAPIGRVTTVMAMMTTGIVVGQALISAVVGSLIDSHGTGAGFLVTSSACALLFVLSCVHMVRHRADVRAASLRS